MKIIDLSIELSNYTGVYPGDPNLKIEQAFNIKKDGVNIKRLSLATHHGTHIDVSNHHLEEGKNLDNFSINDFLNFKVFKIDIFGYDSEEFGIAYKKIITKQDLEKYEKQLSEKDGVIINTGYGKILQLIANGKDKNINKNFPYLNAKAAKYLSLFNLKLIGIDSVTVDAYKENKSHHLLFKKNLNLIILETLVNLESLPENFILNCAPLKIKDADGSPVRAYATFDEKNI